MANGSSRGNWVVAVIVAVGGAIGAIYGFANPGETIGGGLRSFPGVVFGGVCAVLSIAAIAILIRLSKGKSIDS